MKILRRPKNSRPLIALAVGLAIAAGTGVASASPSKPEPPAGAQPAPQLANGACCYTFVTGPVVTLQPGGYDSGTVECPDNQLVFGGGGLNSATSDVVMTDSFPLAYNSHAAWRVYMKNNGTVSRTFSAHAVCGLFTPAG